MNIKNKVVIITGASSGIGRATAIHLSNCGAKLVLGARRVEKLKELRDEIIELGGEAIYTRLDVMKQEDNEKLVLLAKEVYGRVDVMFLNAGLMPNSPLSALKTKDWESMVDINIKGVLNGLAAVLPEFTKQQSGHVIATSSVAGLKAYPGGAVYGATKWAVRDLMEVLRMESAQEESHIRTTTIYPAAVDSELLETISDLDVSNEFQKIYDEYAISPARVASTVAFAISQPEDTTISEITIGPTRQAW